MHWNGSVWSIVPSPNPSPVNVNAFAGVAAVAANDIWAVGWYDDNQRETLIERFTCP